MLLDLMGLYVPDLAGVEGMAPDYATWRAARDLLDKPLTVRHGTGYLWTEFADGRRPTIETLFTTGFRLSCSCTNTRFPCRHLLALLLRAAEEPVQQRQMDARWAEARLEALQALVSPPPLTPDEDARRLAALRAGMCELERWMSDMVHWGLAGLPGKDKRYWSEAADRLADAYAPETARQVRDLAALPGDGRDWPERLLRRLGRLQLLAEGFARFEELPSRMQGDLRAAAGMAPRPGSTAAEAVEDNWLVLGWRSETAGRQRRRRTWLWGRHSGRFAVLAEAAPEKTVTGRVLPPGYVVEAALSFRESAWPLMATAAEPIRPRPALAVEVAAEDIEGAVARASEARAANPWLLHAPMVVGGVFVEPSGGGWRLRDRRGALLPLPDKFAHGWALLARSAGRPLSIFGEWDGQQLNPLSAHLGGWRSLNNWKGLP